MKKTRLKVGRQQHQADLQAGLGRAPLPGALVRKYSNAHREWGHVAAGRVQSFGPVTAARVQRDMGGLSRPGWSA